MAYKIKVGGEYFARSQFSQNESVIKQYSVEVKVISLELLTSTVKNKLLMPALLKNYPDALQFRTHHILLIEPLDEESREAMIKTDPKFMNREDLIRFIKHKELEVDARYFPNLFKLREAVGSALVDPINFKKNFEANREDIVEDIKLHKLNPELYGESMGEFESSVPTPPTTQSTPKIKAIKDPIDFEKQTNDRFRSMGDDLVDNPKTSKTTSHTKKSISDTSVLDDI